MKNGESVRLLSTHASLGYVLQVWGLHMFHLSRAYDSPPIRADTLTITIEKKRTAMYFEGLRVSHLYAFPKEKR